MLSLCVAPYCRNPNILNILNGIGTSCQTDSTGDNEAFSNLYVCVCVNIYFRIYSPVKAHLCIIYLFSVCEKNCFNSKQNTPTRGTNCQEVSNAFQVSRTTHLLVNRYIHTLNYVLKFIFICIYNRELYELHLQVRFHSLVLLILKLVYSCISMWYSIK